ncbi:MAG: damage-inducible protein DinB [Acidobacteriota bacterium]|nr:damage-inducible protein DinB [Acidobacteriota bacterium]
MRIADALLPEVEHEMAQTRKTLLRVPDDKFGFKPHEKSMAMGALAQHIALMAGWGSGTLTSDSFDMAPADGPAYQPPPVKNTAEIVALFDQGVADFKKALASTENDAMMQPWSLLQGGKAIFTMPRAQVIRTMILNHIVHHRGQLSVYLRLNNVAVPALYGPSADES